MDFYFTFFANIYLCNKETEQNKYLFHENDNAVVIDSSFVA